MKNSSGEVLHRWMIGVKDEFWLAVIVEYETPRGVPYLCAYAHLPRQLRRDFDLESLEKITEHLGITYIGPGKVEWNLEKGHTPGVWIGLDWYQQETPSRERIKERLANTCIALAPALEDSP